MTPEQLAEKWLLDPQGGGWPYDPETRPDATLYSHQCLRFADQSKAFVAGYHKAINQITDHLESGKSMKEILEHLKTQQP